MGIIPLKTVLKSLSSSTMVLCMKGPRKALYALARSVQTHGACS